MTLGIVRTVFATSAIALGVISLAFAQREPTLSDIAGCNEQAAARTSATRWRCSGCRKSSSATEKKDRLRHLLVPCAESAVVVVGRGGRLVRDDPVPDPMLVEVFAQPLD